MSENFRKDQELVVKRWGEAEKNRITTKEMIGMTSLENSQTSTICKFRCLDIFGLLLNFITYGIQVAK